MCDSTLRVSLFRAFSIRRGGRPLESLDGGKLQELFCFLLLHRGTSHPREALADLLWGDFDKARSRKYLRQALWQLHSALEAGAGGTQGRLLVIEPASVRLSPGPDLWLDVAVFEQACALVRGVPGAALDPERAQALDRAVELYRGDLLEGWYQDWCLYERERLQDQYLLALDKLMSYCEAQGEYESGLTYGARILRCDRARERAHRRLMRLHYLAGDRTAALRQYERCVASLKEDLGVHPTRRTVALYEQIRADRLEALAAPSEAVRAATSLSADALGRLRQLLALMDDVRGRLGDVQADVQAIERTVRGGA